VGIHAVRPSAGTPKTVPVCRRGHRTGYHATPTARLGSATPTSHGLYRSYVTCVLTLLLLFRRLIAVIRSAWADRTFRGASISLVTLITLATIFYRSVEGWSVVDSLYFAVVTGLTIGYGDFVPQYSISKVFTMFYALLAVGLFVTLGTSLAKASLERTAKRRFRPPPEENSES